LKNQDKICRQADNNEKITPWELGQNVLAEEATRHGTLRTKVMPLIRHIAEAASCRAPRFVAIDVIAGRIVASRLLIAQTPRAAVNDYRRILLTCV